MPPISPWEIVPTANLVILMEWQGSMLLPNICGTTRETFHKAVDGIKRQPLKRLVILSLREVNHGTTEIFWKSKIRHGCGQEREERDAPKEEGHAEIRTRRKRRNREEPEAGDCHRSVGSPPERREGPSQERGVMKGTSSLKD
jgi:hypothetical protein